jgi:hypothetical protein
MRQREIARQIAAEIADPFLPFVYADVGHTRRTCP